MPNKRQPRGPKCKVCGAVMSPKEEGGEPVCWFASSHAEILKVRAAAQMQAAESRKKTRESRQAKARRLRQEQDERTAQANEKRRKNKGR